MPMLLTKILAVFGFITGFLLVCCATFLYEAEERKMQNLLDEWRIRMTDAPKDLPLFRRCMRAALAGPDALFGATWLSVQSLSVCSSLAVSALAAFMIFGITALWSTGSVPPSLVKSYSAVFIGSCIVMSAFTALTAFAVAHPRRAALTLLVPVALILAPIVWHLTLRSTGRESTAQLQVAVAAAVAMSIGITGSSLYFLFIARAILERARRFAGLLDAIVLTAMVLVSAIIPVALVCYALHSPQHASSTPGISRYAEVASGASMAVVVVAIALLILSLVATILLHRLLWPILERPLYALSRLGIARRKGVFRTIGCMLILMSVGPLGAKWITTLFNFLELGG